MKAFFDQIERIFGIRLDAYFPYIIGLIALFFFFNLKHQINVLQLQVANVEGALNMTSSISKSDIAPLSQGINQANERLNKIQAQSAAIVDKLPDLENGLNLANQKLTYLENEKEGKTNGISPVAAETKPTPVH